jgi:sterol desaturase/sphingolipid hydroxylase (fatty acid hydroxylase superfamily)
MVGIILTIFGIIGFTGLVLHDSKSLEFKDSITDPIRLRRNLSFSVAALLVMAIMSFISKETKTFVPNLMHIDDYIALDFITCFLFAELLNWIFHYIKHNNSFFWKFHFQHHIESKYTVWLTSHTHGGEVLLSGTLMGILMGIIGFSTLSVNIYFVFYALANTYQHTNKNISLGFLDKIIVSPRYHRIHHSKSHRANYGSTLTFWDIIFRTAIFPARNEITTDIGISTGDEPFGFTEEMLYFFKSKKAINSSKLNKTLKIPQFHLSSDHQ